MTGNQLRILRQRAGLSQQQLADRWGVSRETISRYETGVLDIPKWTSDAAKTVVKESRNG